MMTAIRVYALEGEERIMLLGGQSKRTLVFSNVNLRRSEIEDDDGH